MIRIGTNADEAAASVRAKRDALPGAVERGMRSALLAVENAAVKNLSGGGVPYSYPVPVRTGNLRGARTVQQPSPGIGIISFTADYAMAVHSGVVTEFAGRGKTRKVQRTARPFAQDAVDSVDVAGLIIEPVSEVLAA
jgi:hypothetical protein